MGLEIERRFLVRGIQWKPYIQKSQKIRQGYLTNYQNPWSIRIRIIENKQCFLTLKASINQISNHEFEYPIPLDDAESLWKLLPNRIEKIRHCVTIQDYNWVIDCFGDKNQDLVIAEIELKTEHEKIPIPSWCTEEISGLKIWSNLALATYPLSIFSSEKRLAGHLPIDK